MVPAASRFRFRARSQTIGSDAIHSLLQEARRLDAMDLALRKKLGVDTEFVTEPPLQKPANSQWVTQYERAHARVVWPAPREPIKSGEAVLSRGNQSARGRIERSIWPSGTMSDICPRKP